jgi:hypothetical protein
MYVPVPDNADAFYAYVNLVINNKNNAHIPEHLNGCPKKIGPVKVHIIYNEVHEPFLEVENNKEKVFLEMIVDQFCLLRSHWNMINSLVSYENSDRY